MQPRKGPRGEHESYADGPPRRTSPTGTGFLSDFVATHPHNTIAGHTTTRPRQEAISAEEAGHQSAE
eukprot:502657-Prorocentrum_lima.AAC.1